MRLRCTLSATWARPCGITEREGGGSTALGRQFRRPQLATSSRACVRSHGRADSSGWSQPWTVRINASPSWPTWRTSAAGAEHVPAEDDMDDAKFVELDSDEPAYGPPALLLLGVSKEDKTRVEAALRECGAEFIPVSSVSEDMLAMSLWDAVQTCGSAEGGSARGLASQQRANGQPWPAGLCIMSGLTGEECMELVDILNEELAHLGDDGLAFAAMLPKSAPRLLRDVVEDILGDHAEIVAQRAAEALSASA